ncbi:MAG: TolC family protein, partial [Gemmatimonadota bacterium]|nr:TolC family protein [Gemmatimonadota bacterium]
MTHPIPAPPTAMNAARTRTGRRRAFALTLLLAVASPCIAGAQQAAGTPTSTALTLDDAIRLAMRESEALQIARAGVTRASGQVKQARSAYYPQLNTNLAYARTLKSQFSALAGGSTTDTSSAPKPQSLCAPKIPANATAAERQAALNQATTCASVQGIDFSKVGFGARNQYTLGLSVAQTVYSGGRVGALTAASEALRRSAEIDLGSQRAQLALDVTQAYFDAVLADRLVVIADTSLAQTEELLRQTTVARRVGNQSEFDLLRATVSRDNQRPVLITRQGDRDVAYLRLKQLLNIPLDAPLQLTTPIDEPAAITTIIASSVTSGAGAGGAASDTTTDRRAPVRESEETVRAQEGQLKSARADLLPSLSITSNYQRLFFPNNFLPSINQFSENWTVGGSISYSLFSGGRIGGQVEVAQANLDESRARLQQSRELAALDTRVALNQLASAQSSFEASRGTAQQAQKAYSIDQLRFREGISTQTDLTQSRLLLEQAVANQAQSARDLAVARARLALIRDLPINTAALGAGAQRAAAQQQQTQQQPTQQTRTQSTAAGTAGAGTFGSPT